MTSDYQVFMNGKDSSQLTTAQMTLLRRSRNRVDSILGPAPPGGHAVSRGGTGPCRICAKVAQLTFEHVPPQSSGNKRPRRAVDTATALAQRGLDIPSRGWISMQRGAGDYVACSDCNSFGGTAYVPAYSDAVSAALIALGQWVKALSDDEELPETVRLQAHRHFQPGAVIRQALFQLWAMSGSAGLTTKYPELRRIVLGKELLKLLPEMSIRLTLLDGNTRYRIGPVTGDVDLATLEERAVIDVAHVPLGWLAEIGPPSSRSALDVSSWTEIDPDDVIDVDLVVPVGSVVSPLAGDYRHRWQIPQDPPDQA